MFATIVYFFNYTLIKERVYGMDFNKYNLEIFADGFRWYKYSIKVLV